MQNIVHVYGVTDIQYKRYDTNGKKVYIKWTEKWTKVKYGNQAGVWESYVAHDWWLIMSHYLVILMSNAEWLILNESCWLTQTP